MVKVNGRINSNTLLNVLEKYVEKNPNYCGEYRYNPYDSMKYSSYPQHYEYYHHYPQYFFQPPPPPPQLVPRPFPPPPPPGLCWEAPQPTLPSPPRRYNYGPPPSTYPPSHAPSEVSSRQNKHNKCAMM